MYWYQPARSIENGLRLWPLIFLSVALVPGVHCQCDESLQNCENLRPTQDVLAWGYLLNFDSNDCSLARSYISCVQNITSCQSTDSDELYLTWQSYTGEANVYQYLCDCSELTVPVLQRSQRCFVDVNSTYDPSSDCEFGDPADCSFFDAYVTCVVNSVREFCNEDLANIAANVFGLFHLPFAEDLGCTSDDISATELYQVNGTCNANIDNSTLECDVNCAAGCDSTGANHCDGPCYDGYYLTETNTCTPLPPPVTSVTLLGPTVIDRLWIEFYCVIETPIDDADARFKVDFQFNGGPGNVPALLAAQPGAADVTSFIVNTSNLSVTLHEKYLQGKLETWLQCVVQSYWATFPTTLGTIVRSNSYFLSLQSSTSFIWVSENDVTPQTVHLQSTLPITCHDAATAAGTAPCNLTLNIHTAPDIVVYQTGLGTSQPCKYLLTESHNPQGSWYYNASQSLAVAAKVDPYHTSERYSRVSFTFPTLPLKTAGGYTYVSLWSQYNPPSWLSPTVYRYDFGEAVLTCTGTADVHYQTFDGLFYSSYGSGYFIYSRSTAGRPFEFQAQQESCYGPFTSSDITCICGVAMREDDTILILNACQGGAPLVRGRNHENLPNGSGIFADNSGYSFKIQMPSGNRVYVDYWGYIMNIRLVVVGRPQIRGMCGSPDGNAANDLINQFTNITEPPVAGGWAGPQGPVDIVESWRPGDGLSLFDGYLAPLPNDGLVINNIAAPDASTDPSCWARDSNVYPNDPDRPVNVQPLVLPSSKRRRRRSVDGLADADPYNPSLFRNATKTKLIAVTWPTTTGITEQEANDTCWSLIVNEANLGPTCMDILRTSASAHSAAQDVVTKCVLDVQLTSNFSWARDKVAELQKSCYFLALTKNNSDVEDPNVAIQMAVSDVQQVTDSTCVPYDCNSHGSCVNGACECTADYIGADCRVSKYAVPTVSSFLTPADCDVRSQPCNLATLQTDNAASTPSLSCKVVATLQNKTAITYIETGEVTVAQTVTCNLPTEPLYLTSASFNFASAHKSGYRFYCLPPGSPVTAYTVSVSNDGNSFSDGITMRVIDTLCMSCDSQTCSLASNTCLINGYCFDAGETNPYNSTQSCQPSFSSSLWSDRRGADAGATCKVPASGPTTTRRPVIPKNTPCCRRLTAKNCLKKCCRYRCLRHRKRRRHLRNRHSHRG